MRRFPVPVLWAGLILIAAGACSKDNPVRPQFVSNVTTRVDPVTYLGPCPGTFNVSADITAGAGTITYRWERSDGTYGPSETLSFSKAGTQTVTESWRPGGVGPFWERVHILTPIDLYSDKATFTNGCGSLAIMASAHVTPSNYTLGCPGNFDFSADITANGAANVTYRWERSDGYAGPIKTVSFTGAGTQTVTDSWRVGAIGSFWGQLHLITPIDRVSNEATFTNACGAVLGATASVSPSQYSGDCPGVFDVSADITSHAGVVTYRWERSDGTAGPTGTITFPYGGTRTVTDSWQLATIGSFGDRVHVLTPNDVYSNVASFTNDCGASGPFTVTAVTGSVYSYDCEYFVTAHISANGGGGVGAVTYRWERSDGMIGPTETVNFSGPGTQMSESVLPVEDGVTWIRVHVLTPNELLSSETSFDIGCQMYP